MIAINICKHHQCWSGTEVFVTCIGVVLEIVDVSCNSVTVLSQFPLVEDIFNVGLVVGIGDVVGGVLNDVIVGSSLELHQESWQGWGCW